MKIVKKVAGIISNQDSKILIFKEFSGNRQGFFYNIVKGTVEDSDINLYASLSREIYEETGLENCDIGRVIDMVVKVENNIVTTLIAFEVFSAANILINNANNIEGESIKDHIWISKEDFMNIPQEDFMDLRIYTLISTYLKV